MMVGALAKVLALMVKSAQFAVNGMPARLLEWSRRRKRGRGHSFAECLGARCWYDAWGACTVTTVPPWNGRTGGRFGSNTVAWRGMMVPSWRAA